jgi:predicted secreted protein
MSVTTAIAIYFVLWWIVLFAVLPWGIRSQAEQGDVVEGSDPGAPAVPHLWAKLGWTTLVSAIVFGVCAVVYLRGWVTFETLGLMPPAPRG